MVAKKKIVFLMLLTFLLIFVEPFLGYAANKSISAGSSKTADIDTAGNLKFSVKKCAAISLTFTIITDFLNIFTFYMNIFIFLSSSFYTDAFSIA